MRKIRDVLRYRHSAGLSLEAIARALKISKGVVAKYLRLAGTAGLSWPIPDELDDSELEKCRRAFKRDHACALNFDQGLRPPLLRGGCG